MYDITVIGAGVVGGMIAAKFFHATFAPPSTPITFTVAYKSPEVNPSNALPSALTIAALNKPSS